MARRIRGVGTAREYFTHPPRYSTSMTHPSDLLAGARRIRFCRKVEAQDGRWDLRRYCGRRDRWSFLTQNYFGAVKKIKLQGGKKSADEKILREVSALRLLTHRYIVRYYTTWTEIAAPPSQANSGSDSDDSDTDTVDGSTSVPNSKSRSSRSWSNNSENLLSIDLNDFGSNPNSNRSFPNVHFGYADGTGAEGSSDEEPVSEDESHLGVDPAKTPKALTVGSFAPQQKILSRGSQVTLYIQMVCSLSVWCLFDLNPHRRNLSKGRRSESVLRKVSLRKKRGDFFNRSWRHSSTSRTAGSYAVSVHAIGCDNDPFAAPSRYKTDQHFHWCAVVIVLPPLLGYLLKLQMQRVIVKVDNF